MLKMFCRLQTCRYNTVQTRRKFGAAVQIRRTVARVVAANTNPNFNQAAKAVNKNPIYMDQTVGYTAAAESKENSEDAD